MTEKRRSATLRVEALETRETPSRSPASPAAVVAQENFAQTTIGELPAGWTQWDSQASFQVLPGRALNGNAGLVASGSSGETARAWLATTQPANVQISSTLRLDSIIPAELMLRGHGLNTTSPTYYDLTLSRGLNLQLWRVVDGNRTYLGSLRTSDYLSGAWVRVSFQANGNTLRAMVYRLDTKQYLNPLGQWEAQSTWALVRTDSAIKGAGFVGLGRQPGYAGDTVFDDFQARPLSRGIPVSTAGFAQQFDHVPVGGLPPNWVQWSNQAPAAVAADPTFSLAKALRFEAGSGNNARAWISDNLPADLEVTASILVNNLIPSEVFVRGHGLDTATPTYYAATLKRGLNVQLWKVVNGVRTSIGSVRSRDYLSGVWTRVSLDVEGSTLRVRVQRLDTGLYLDSSGRWVKTAGWALVRTDGTITGPGKVGLGREASYSGISTFENLKVTVPNTPPPEATLTGLADGAVVSSSVSVRAKVADTISARRVDFYVDGRRVADQTRGPFQWTINPGSFSAGPHQLDVRILDGSGSPTILERDFTVAKASPPSGGNPSPPPAGSIPSHYSYIRLAELAYYGMSFGSKEDQLLRNSIDLVIPDVRFLRQINSVAPNTPQLLYTNASSLYQESLLDWLNYADVHGISREDAFYHVATPTPFTGESPSSQPVYWFWGVYATKPGGLTDFTSNAHSPDNKLTLGERGQSLYVGYTDPFREINFNLASGAASGWAGVLEYATRVDGHGRPTAWAPLRTLADTTGGLKHSGRITFDPPRDWNTSIVGGTSRLFYVRIRTVSSGTAPVARTILGRDYVNARGSKAGVIPVFDYSADLNHDGYLNDVEWAHRTPGMNARFAYESRDFLPYYGQMRPATNPSNANLRAWLVNYEERFLASHPLSDGIFVDNSGGKSPVTGQAVLENTLNYTADYATLISQLSKALAPKWVLVNTSNGTSATNAIVGGANAYFEEFALRPLSGTYQQFEDLANAVATRQNSHGSTPPYAILDSLPVGGSPTDPRTQLATLAEYYLLADPKYTFLDFYGGYAPNSQWSQHFTKAVNVNVGQPRGDWSLHAAGLDPSNRSLTYHVYAREYTNALILFRPLSYSSSSGAKGSLGDRSETTLQLRGTYRSVNADGTLGKPVTSISLCNGEGAILIRS
jgi:hypothetical protein